MFREGWEALGIGWRRHGRGVGAHGSRLIVPTLCVGMHFVTLCVALWDAERPGLHSHAERGNDRSASQ
ncbi:hypothetical protein B5P22_28040 [Pseudomonas tolaasii]|nr:hypothetical protein B5P22_28040 [Pseudomonas tolaasii]